MKSAVAQKALNNEGRQLPQNSSKVPMPKVNPPRQDGPTAQAPKGQAPKAAKG
jgi:hypothetical protein